MAEGIDCYRMQFPKGMDANAYALEAHARRRNRWGVLIRKAEWLGKGDAPRHRPATTAAWRRVAVRCSG